MPNTLNGLPYPVSTDPIAQGANAIKALADTVDVTYDTGIWRLTANQAIPTSVFTVLATNAAVSVDAPAFTNSAGVVTCLKAGTYEAAVQVRWATGAGPRRYVAVTKNVTTIDSGGTISAGGTIVTAQMVTPVASSVFGQVIRSARFTAVANDTVRVFVFQDSGGNLDASLGVATDYLGFTQLTVMRVTP